MKIVSGAQTGVDRGALDAAKLAGLERGGWCPRGRLAEDGRIPDEYEMIETPSIDYKQRTGWNVRDSDATLILVRDMPINGGTRLTHDLCGRMGKPTMVARIGVTASSAVRAWLASFGVVNVAGPRESKAKGIQAEATRYLVEVFRC